MHFRNHSDFQEFIAVPTKQISYLCHILILTEFLASWKHLASNQAAPPTLLSEAKEEGRPKTTLPCDLLAKNLLHAFDKPNSANRDVVARPMAANARLARFQRRNGAKPQAEYSLD